MRSKGKRNTINSKNKGTIAKNKTSKKTYNYNIVAKILALVCLVSVVVFEITLIKLNILPAKYMFVALLVFTPLGVLVLLGLFFNKVKKKLRITAAVVSVILILVSFASTSYITGTMSFLDKISSIGQTFSYEEFYVIVKADSDIDDMDDLADTEIGILSVANESYSSARNELKELIECEYENVDDLETLGSELLNGSKKVFF